MALCGGKSSASVVVTLGDKGSLVVQKGHAPVIVPVPQGKVTAIDTTGAGDCFIG